MLKSLFVTVAAVYEKSSCAKNGVVTTVYYGYQPARMARDLNSGMLLEKVINELVDIMGHLVTLTW